MTSKSVDTGSICYVGYMPVKGYIMERFSLARRDIPWAGVHLVFTTSTDGSNRLYDLRTGSGRPVRGLRAADRVLRWSPDGKSLWV
jgi:hypothetical protein